MLKQCEKQVPLFFGEKSLNLLLSAEALIEESECRNHCIRYVAGRPCRDCGSFMPSASGYITCDGYLQAGDIGSEVA